ncbi:uncharacterized protein [Cicer arietinum]|uniref:uncharacterized protein isoform X1 n=1 Tax=Cicer arietinum TaxID=3827 RepID=UPI003CC54909
MWRHVLIQKKLYMNLIQYIYFLNSLLNVFVSLHMDAHDGGVNDLGFSYPNNKLWFVICGDDKLIKSFDAYGNDNTKSGFWGVLAHKAKSILDDKNSAPPPQHDTMPLPQTLKSHSFNTFTSPFSTQPLYQSPDSNKKMDNPTIRKGLDAIKSSLNHLGDTFEKAFEDSKTIVESKTADLRSQIRRKRKWTGGHKPSFRCEESMAAIRSDKVSFSPLNTTQGITRRKVAMATAAKAKLLLRELKTVKADLAFAKRCICTCSRLCTCYQKQTIYFIHLY